jgi:hypothetical protein
MVKTRLIPDSRTFEIQIPESFIGTNVDIQITSDSEQNDLNQKPKTGWIKKFKGIIPPELADKMNFEINKLRNE